MNRKINGKSKMKQLVLRSAVSKSGTAILTVLSALLSVCACDEKARSGDDPGVHCEILVGSADGDPGCWKQWIMCDNDVQYKIDCTEDAGVYDCSCRVDEEVIEECDISVASFDCGDGSDVGCCELMPDLYL